MQKSHHLIAEQYSTNVVSTQPLRIRTRDGKSYSFTPEQIKQMRDWVSDCDWLDSDDIEDMSDLEIVKGVNHHFDGGLSGFLASC